MGAAGRRPSGVLRGCCHTWRLGTGQQHGATRPHHGGPRPSRGVAAARNTAVVAPTAPGPVGKGHRGWQVGQVRPGLGACHSWEGANERPLRGLSWRVPGDGGPESRPAGVVVVGAQEWRRLLGFDPARRQRAACNGAAMEGNISLPAAGKAMGAGTPLVKLMARMEGSVPSSP